MRIKHKENKTITVTKYDWVNHLTLKKGNKVKINIKDITYVRKSDDFDLWIILNKKATVFVEEKYARRLIGYKHFKVMRNAFEELTKRGCG